MLRRVMGGVKRSPAYRRICGGLTSRCPADAWLEDDLCFVHFHMGQGPDTEHGWAVFAVRADDGQLVAAKKLIPDKTGQEVVVSELLT